MAKKKEAASTEVAQPKTALFRATCRYTSAGWGKTSAKLGVKISSKTCTARIRDEYLANATLRVIISADPEVENPPIAGMENAYPAIEVDVKVNQYSANAGEISFSMSIDRGDVPAQFLKDIAHSAGSFFVLSVKHDESESTDDAEDDSED